MPIILKCTACGKETSMGYPANQGWYAKPQIGGTEVLCPDCQQKKATAPTANDNDDATQQLANLSNKQPVDLAEYGVKLLNLFREEQRKRGRGKGCLCPSCQGDMVNALKKANGAKEITEP